MGMLLAVAGGSLIAFALGWVGTQGLLGIPDSNGKKTPKGTAVASLVIAVLVVVGTIILPFLIRFG